MEKTWNNKAWFMVLPAFLIVAFSAIIPLMTVVNYSVQDTFGNNEFFWAGTEWFTDVLESDRFWGSLKRNLLFSGIILVIEIPLGVFIALHMPRKGIGVPICLVTMAMPLLIPWNVVGTIFQLLLRTDIGLVGYALAKMGISFNYAAVPLDAWITVVMMDVWHWTSLVVLLAYAGLVSIPDAYYQAARIDGASRFSVFRYIQLPKDETGADDCVLVTLHGFLHDLYGAVRGNWWWPRNVHNIPLDRFGENGHWAIRPWTCCCHVNHLLPYHPVVVMDLLHSHDKHR